MCVIRTRHGPGRLLSTYLRSHLRGILIHSRARPIGRRVGTQFSITDWNGKRFLVDCLQYSNLEFYCDRLSAIPPHCPVDYGLSAQFPPPHPNLSFFRFPLAQQFPPTGKTFFYPTKPSHLLPGGHFLPRSSFKTQSHCLGQAVLARRKSINFGA